MTLKGWILLKSMQVDQSIVNSTQIDHTKLIRGPIEKKVTKSGKSPQFSWHPPPSPRMIWTFLNLEKIGIWRPPPQTYFGEKLKLAKFWIFRTPHKTRNISLKHSKLSKNHFKTNLLFVQLKCLKCAFTFGKKMKKWPPTPLLSKSPHFELWTFWFLALIPPPFWTFSTFCDIFFSISPLR